MNLTDQELLRTDSYIDGAWVPADSGDRFDVLDPATGESLASVADLGQSETRRAIEAAEAALPAWKALTGKQRSSLLRR